ncbi:hypothetical protein D3C78_1039530 [compost metagenome]
MDRFAAQQVEAQRRLQHRAQFARPQREQAGFQLRVQGAGLDDAEQPLLHGGGALRMLERLLGEALRLAAQALADRLDARQGGLPGVFRKVRIDGDQDVPGLARGGQLELLEMTEVVQADIGLADLRQPGTGALQHRLDLQLARQHGAQPGRVEPLTVERRLQRRAIGVTAADIGQRRLDLRRGDHHAAGFRTAQHGLLDLPLALDDAPGLLQLLRVELGRGPPELLVGHLQQVIAAIAGFIAHRPPPSAARPWPG